VVEDNLERRSTPLTSLTSPWKSGSWTVPIATVPDSLRTGKNVHPNGCEAKAPDLALRAMLRTSMINTTMLDALV
jgi:hypothetical protein